VQANGNNTQSRWEGYPAWTLLFKGITGMIITVKPPPCDGTEHSAGNQQDVQYRRWVASISTHLADNYGAGPLFTTNVGPYLWDWYINAFPPDMQAYHTCTACRQFIERYGSLVSINGPKGPRPTANEDGRLIPAMWDVGRVPKEYKVSVRAMVDILKGYGLGTNGGNPPCHVTGVFYSSDKVWGRPCTGQRPGVLRTTGNWYHLALIPPSSLVYSYVPEQAMATKAEDYRLLKRLLGKYTKPRANGQLSAVKELLRLPAVALRDSTWQRLTWLDAVATNLLRRHAIQMDNLIWYAAATAPKDFCRMGELLDSV